MRRYPKMADGVVVRMACGRQGVGEQLRHPRAAELLRRQADRMHHNQAHTLTRRALVKVWRRKEKAHGRRSKRFALCRRRWTLTASPFPANRVVPLGEANKAWSQGLRRAPQSHASPRAKKVRGEADGAENSRLRTPALRCNNIRRRSTRPQRGQTVSRKDAVQILAPIFFASCSASPQQDGCR